jgi:hypothetical protein
MQQAAMDGTPPAETFRMYENISSFYISQHLADMSRGAKHLLDGKVNLTLTQVNLLDWERIVGDEGTLSCPYTTCRLTSDFSAKTDGYIFSPYGEPPHGQLFPGSAFRIFRSHESPAHLAEASYDFTRNFQFDFSNSYRWDSDAISPYGAATLLENPAYPPGSEPRDYFQEKSKLAYWLVSNWSGRRVQVFEELVKLFEIDLMGGKRDAFSAAQWNVWLDKVKPVICWEPGAEVPCEDYLFYLAFENSECDQYITEKPWRALQLGNVPVVLGGLSPAEYTEFLPPRSFIHIDDFDSIERLADYLLYLQGNATAYNEYHAWRQYYAIQGTWLNWDFCLLCDSIAISKASKMDQRRRSAGQWWLGREEGDGADIRGGSCRDG